MTQRAPVKWSAERVAELKRYVTAGYTAKEVAELMGETYGTISNAKTTYLTDDERRRVPRTKVQPLDAVVHQHDQIPEWLEQLRPVALPAPPKARTTILSRF